MPPFIEKWPRWPADTAGKEVMAVQVQCSVDTLFETAFQGESDYTVSTLSMRIAEYLASCSLKGPRNRECPNLLSECRAGMQSKSLRWWLHVRHSQAFTPIDAAICLSETQLALTTQPVST